MVLATAAAHHATTTTTQSNDFIGPLSVQTVFAIVAGLLLWVVVYMVYRMAMAKRKDFGVPVKRRILTRKLRIDHDQSADAPFWWTDLQIQLAVGNHWRQALRNAAITGNDPHPSVL